MSIETTRPKLQKLRVSYSPMTKLREWCRSQGCHCTSSLWIQSRFWKPSLVSFLVFPSCLILCALDPNSPLILLLLSIKISSSVTLAHQNSIFWGRSQSRLHRKSLALLARWTSSLGYVWIVLVKVLMSGCRIHVYEHVLCIKKKNLCRQVFPGNLFGYHLPMVNYCKI